MPAAKDPKKAAALRMVWLRLRQYFAALMADTPENKNSWRRAEEGAAQRLAEREAKEK